MAEILPVKNLEPILKESYGAFLELIRFVRVRYIMDELYNGKDELKFRKSGKTLLTMYVKEGKFNALVIFGKAERAVFEENREKFSPYICDYYDNSKTYHDGKWMAIEITDEKYIPELIEMLKIKKNPNRKKMDFSMPVNNEFDPALCDFGSEAEEITKIVQAYYGQPQ